MNQLLSSCDLDNSNISNFSNVSNISNVSDPKHDFDFFCEGLMEPICQRSQQHFQNFPVEFVYLWDQLGVCKISALRYRTNGNQWKTWTTCRMLLEYALDFQSYGTVLSDPDWLGPWTDFVQILGNELDKEQNGWNMISERTRLGFFENFCDKEIHEYIFYKEFCTEEKTTTCALKCNCVNGSVDVFEYSESNPFASGIFLGQFIPEYTMQEVKDKSCDEANVQRFFLEFYPFILHYFGNQVVTFGGLKQI
jgi:hypothetical protein